MTPLTATVGDDLQRLVVTIPVRVRRTGPLRIRGRLLGFPVFAIHRVDIKGPAVRDGVGPEMFQQRRDPTVGPVPVARLRVIGFGGANLCRQGAENAEALPRNPRDAARYSSCRTHASGPQGK